MTATTMILSFYAQHVSCTVHKLFKEKNYCSNTGAMALKLAYIVSNYIYPSVCIHYFKFLVSPCNVRSLASYIAYSPIYGFIGIHFLVSLACNNYIFL